MAKCQPDILQGQSSEADLAGPSRPHVLSYGPVPAECRLWGHPASPWATLALLFWGPGVAGHDRWSCLVFSPG